jgi:hypothetical protein
MASAIQRRAALAAKIRATNVPRLIRYSAHRVVALGDWLTEAKADEAAIPRGDWQRWLKQEANIPKATAFHYMRLASFVSEGLITVDDVAELGQFAALKLALAKGRAQRSW